MTNKEKRSVLYKVIYIYLFSHFEGDSKIKYSINSDFHNLIPY